MCETLQCHSCQSTQTVAEMVGDIVEDEPVRPIREHAALLEVERTHGSRRRQNNDRGVAEPHQHDITMHLGQSAERLERRVAQLQQVAKDGDRGWARGQLEACT